MSIIDYYNRQIPEYYDWMYLDGYSPTEILIAMRKKWNRELSEQDIFNTISVKSEVKIKR